MCGFEGSADNLAAMARWTHPYPCRTRKLSIAAATIVGNGKNSTLPVCPVPKGTPFFLPEARAAHAEAKEDPSFTTAVHLRFIFTKVVKIKTLFTFSVDKVFFIVVIDAVEAAQAGMRSTADVNRLLHSQQRWIK